MSQLVITSSIALLGILVVCEKLKVLDRIIIIQLSLLVLDIVKVVYHECLEGEVKGLFDRLSFELPPLCDCHARS